ncbi:terminase large subunit domain-containing protein [Campylobacter vulpis]|uniref:terminase large subunit domain-containing protein n=1 Tax=Campylobacter vulpis TaxID=1655500 RepID=UPI000C148C2A|nr:terminase family protein [Campylobacter vulpis]MBS4276043.1 hypothetical protein [Campylobacter vulpis]MBS4307428.1 hypothetical protein [Campylobacter vulpis]MBS4330369.1 hypothetical protein [Campylobacter vulpis]MBS4423939.1 hypothetical protein [Campylobacter vulpis]PHY89934.1 phage-related CUP0950-like protein [Campylobacter vulpis]
MKEASEYKKELILRALAKKDFYTFLRLKWERYNKAAFLENWHFNYLCEVLSLTLPYYAKENNAEILRRLMLNMPPSYGKTETIARSFIAWALGNDRKRKFIYISYSDELCKKICNQVRDLIKSSFFLSIFEEKPSFLQDNSKEFVLSEGGGLFVTTLKSAITGFHADQILIDDPIKVSAMSSKAERKLVNENFKESVLTRLQNTNSNITILMQRLGYEDLCGFLLDKRNFEENIINEWKILKLEALNKEAKVYKIGSFSYERKANEPLFAKKHDLKQLKELELQMGIDAFTTQYQQEPQASEAGFFEGVYFKEIPSYEMNANNEYMFIDNALSVEQNADNRAVVVIGVDKNEQMERYIIKDCFYGVWDEEKTLSVIIEALIKYKKAKCYIENEGGGILLTRLLNKEIVKVNEKLKRQNLEIITNEIIPYNANRKISKVEKIKAMKPYYNSGALLFLNTAQGLGQIKKELLGFNPAKPFRKDDCIDCIASAMSLSEVKSPHIDENELCEESPMQKLRKKSYYESRWNI